MTELLNTFGSSIRPIDFLDVAIVSYIVYRLLLLIKGTRAVQMLTGFGILGIAFMLSIKFELYTLHWILSYFFDSLILLVIVLFQDEIRRALTYVGKNPFFSSASTAEEMEMVSEVSRTATRLAHERIGALIVIERETGLKNFIDTGSKIDAKVRNELLYSVFIPTSPIHDGASIISDGRIAAAGCFLPLSKNPNIDKKLGTRHRAAIGLSEETDAVIILVSEESGEAYLVRNGKMTPSLSEDDLRNSLMAVLELHDSSRIGRLRLRRSRGGR